MAVLVLLLRDSTLAHVVRAYSDEVDKEKNQMRSCSKKGWQVEVSPEAAELALRFCNRPAHLARAVGIPL